MNSSISGACAAAEVEVGARVAAAVIVGAFGTGCGATATTLARAGSAAFGARPSSVARLPATSTSSIAAAVNGTQCRTAAPLRAFGAGGLRAHSARRHIHVTP